MRAHMGVRVQFHRGSWWIFISHRGKRRSKKVGDRETALDIARKIRQRLAEGDLRVVRPNDAETFEKYADRWLTGGEGGRKASTHRFYEFNLRLHINPSLGARPIAAISRADCRDLLGKCRERGLKRASLLGVQRTLSAVLSQAVEDALIPANPAFRMGKHLRFADEQPAAIQPFTHSEAHRFLEVVMERQPEYHAFFLCALRTGMRLGELLALQWGDIDFGGRFIEVRRNLVGRRVTSTKNTSRRRIDMSLKLTEKLLEHQRRAKALSLKGGRKLPSWVFTTPEGKHLDGDNLRTRVFYPLVEGAKLRDIRLHDLRHTFASLLIQNGEPLTYVKEQMGHSSIQVTVDVYGHLVPSANRAAVDKLDAHPVCIPGASDQEDEERAATAK